MVKVKLKLQHLKKVTAYISHKAWGTCFLLVSRRWEPFGKEDIPQRR